MGALGAWTLACENPSLFAALVPIVAHREPQ